MPKGLLYCNKNFNTISHRFLENHLIHVEQRPSMAVRVAISQQARRPEQKRATGA